MSDKPNLNELMKGVIPYLGLERATEAAEFYKRAFGAEQLGEIARDEAGVVMHISLAINGGVLMLMDYMPGMGAPLTPAGGNNTLQLVVADGPAWWDRAVAAGCTVTVPFARHFWGDDYGRLVDPFGQHWAILQPSAENMAANA